MRKLKTLLVIIIFAPILKAQETRFGIKGGINVSNQKFDIDAFNIINFDYDTNSRLGWQMGVLLDAPLDEQFSIQPALLLISKGYEFEENNILFDVEITSKPLYLHIPAPVLFHTDLADVDVFVGAGPYLSYGIGGQADVEGDIIGLDFINDGDIEWGNDDGDTYSPFDAGLVITAGIDLADNIRLGASYELGLANIFPDGDSDNRIRNRTFLFDLSYFLN